MRLVDLDPRWIDYQGNKVDPISRSGLGITFLCPTCLECGGVTAKMRIAIMFTNPLDGGGRVSLAPERLWMVLWPPNGEGRHRGDLIYQPGHFNRQGESFETLSVIPEIDMFGHWHGTITQGEVRTL